MPTGSWTESKRMRRAAEFARTPSSDEERRAADALVEGERGEAQELPEGSWNERELTNEAIGQRSAMSPTR